MALQGTLDTFALPDVLRLLAATRKTGRLRLSGARGTGAVWVEAGSVVTIEAAHAPHAVDAVEALFELLRFEDGAFTFDVDLVHDDPAPATDVDVLLAAAEDQLAEWRQIEAVVPSLDAWVALRPDLASSEVVIDRERWSTLVAVGTGATVRRVGDELCLSEMAVSRAVKALVELGVAEVDDAPPTGTALDPASVGAAMGEPARVEAPIADPGPAFAAPTPAPAPARAPVADPPPATFDLNRPDRAASPLDRPAPAAEVDGDLARQLANLSPRAAEAVRAATTASSDVERAAALAEAEAAAEEEDDSVNRGLLLKFLSSVKT